MRCSLSIMAFALVCIFIFLLIDQILGNLDTNAFQYTIFYFVAWAAAIVAVINAYYGYINPKVK
jgi:branched-subunit amino acid transport protein